jgi:hypothetical protein
LIIIAGGIGLSAALDLWSTESTKVPVRYETGDFEGEYNPADIRGSYSFDDIAASFDVSVEDLAKAFAMEANENPGAIKAKDLETVYGELEEGEVGTDSIRYFVALYTGRPYEPEEGTLLPSPAVSVLRDMVSEDILSTVSARTVSLGSLKEASGQVEEHVEDPEDTTVKGKTTFGDLSSWGLTNEEIEAAIGMKAGKSGITVRDHVVSAGSEFAAAKAALQELVDSK